MAGTSVSLKEQVARNILKIVRSQGHPYVELRENGKNFIYYCILCFAPCYGDSALFDHLKGKLHTRRLPAAKVTLLGPNPWPFDDGLIFFDMSTKNNLANVKFGENLNTTDNSLGETDGSQCGKKHLDSSAVQSGIRLTADKVNDDFTLLIPRMLSGDEVSDVTARKVGLGKISARFYVKDKVPDGIRRIWCEWFGNYQQGGVQVPDHDFALIIFSYHYYLGVPGLLYDMMKSLLPPAPTMSESENEGDSGWKGKKSLSDPEDISGSLSNQYDSSVEQLLRTKLLSSKAVRKKLRAEQRLASEKLCELCKHKMLPGKDVATLFNLATGRVACCSRSKIGAFHVFHISCLIHWILFCEFEITTNDLVLQEARRGTKRKIGANVNEIGTESEMKPAGKQIKTVFCPECQGTGIIGDAMEKSHFNVLEMIEFKIKAWNARREWMKTPEILQNCSVGFQFPSESGEMVQEQVKPLKWLHFYRADEQSQMRELCKPGS